MTVTPVPLNTDPARPRAAAVVRGGSVTWSCPLCEHRSVTDPVRRLDFVLTRARYHMRWAHGHLPITGWAPAGARPVTPLEAQNRVLVPRRCTSHAGARHYHVVSKRGLLAETLAA